MKNKIIKILLIFFTLSSIFAIQAKSHKIIKRPLITRIAHVAIFTKDLESDFQFYKNYLGFSALDVSSKKSADLNSIKINNFQSLKILPEKIKGGNRLSHFSLQTNNADAMRQYLAAKGVKVPEKILKGRLGNRSFFITDPNGTRLEIIQSKASYQVDDRITEIPDTRIANRMSHVGFMVPDLDKALAFYCDILGFTETWRGSKDGKNVTWVNLKVPDGDDYIELMLYDKEQTEEAMGVLNHICLEVEDVSESDKTLRSRELPKGCKITTQMKIGVNRKRQINCFDINGTRVEIMEASTVDRKSVPSSRALPLKFIPSY